MLATALVVESAMPAGSTAALALLVDRFGSAPDGGLVGATLPALLLYGAALAMGQAATAAAAPLTAVAAGRIDGMHRTRVSRVATSTRMIDKLERSRAQILLREAVVDRSRGYNCTPSDGALAQLRILAALVGAASMCAVLASFAWWLPLFGLLPALVNRTVRNRESRDITSHWKAAAHGELHADVWRRAAVSPGDGKDVRIFGFGSWMVGRMQDNIRDANAPLWTYISRMLRRLWLPFLVIVLGLAPAYVIVSVRAVDGATTAAVAVAVISGGWGLLQVLQPDFDHYQLNGSLQTLGALDRLRDLLADDACPAAAGDAAAADAVPHIKFDKVSFHYPGSERLVLNELDLELAPGELLAIVGLNGAGKSTLIKLMAGLYAPTAGRITVDGVDLARLDPARWRARMAVVFQDFVRHDLSAAENVEFGYCWKPMEERSLVAAGSEAGFDEVVGRLSNGWDTPLSRARTGGTDLSGGQWQQLVLTRALYAVNRGARLLVLDEPTAHLDVRTEFEVFGKLAERRGETGVVLISHRLSTVREADRIVLLEDGRITESGTHDELIAHGGQYARLFDIQAERFRRGYDDRAEERWAL
ncbi:ABC transporter ATP-binding protein [Streptomyces sp. NPDC050560]|uniref:ABC transporter ATP-binding protein n=1 Tax=Streptomyces sp. NPDC050560 TaxID=3365630 RepID=UPI0037A2583B